MSEAGVVSRYHELDNILRLLSISCTPPVMGNPLMGVEPCNIELGWQQEARPTAVSPFPAATDYFWRFQANVDGQLRDLDAMAGQLRAAASESKWTSSITEMVALPACATLRAIRLSSGNLRVALPYARVPRFRLPRTFR